MPVQQTAPQPPSPPQGPGVVGRTPEGFVIQTPGGQITLPQAAAPLTRRQIQQIRDQREELSSQLTSATERRNRLAEELKDADGAARAGIEERIRLLDQRILQLEADIASTGRLLTSAPVVGDATTEVAEARILGLEEDNFVTLGGATIVFVLFPLAIAYSRRLWKRSSVAPPVQDMETRQRLERIEQAVDAIAIEVERVSEGQRFTTRLLSEAMPHVALGAGERGAEPIRVREREGLEVKRQG